ncbi:MAG: RNase H family protein [Myxococcaceae bacterium]
MISIYCDGSTRPTGRRPGGWAFALVSEDQVIAVRSGRSVRTTNNQMELRAALEGLREVITRGLHWKGPIELVSDSRYALEIANGSYLPTKDLTSCHALRAACVEAGAVARWVRGHSGDRWNEWVNEMAAEASKSRSMTTTVTQTTKRSSGP